MRFYRLLPGVLVLTWLTSSDGAVGGPGQPPGVPAEKAGGESASGLSVANPSGIRQKDQSAQVPLRPEADGKPIAAPAPEPDDEPISPRERYPDMPSRAKWTGSEVEALRELVAFLKEWFEEESDAYDQGGFKDRSGRWKGGRDNVALEGCELGVAKAQLAWAQGDREGAVGCLEEALSHADDEIKVWQAIETAGQSVDLERRGNAAKRRATVKATLAQLRRFLAAQSAQETQKAGPPPLLEPEAPVSGFSSATEPVAIEATEALRELEPVLEEWFSKQKTWHDAGGFRDRWGGWLGLRQDMELAGYELCAARARLACAEGDVKRAAASLEDALSHADFEMKVWDAIEHAGQHVNLPRRINAVKRRTALKLVLANLSRSLASQRGKQPIEESVLGPLLQPEVLVWGPRPRMQQLDPDELEALQDLVAFLEKCFKDERDAHDQGGGARWEGKRENVALAGCELGIVKAQLAWAQGDRKGAVACLEEAVAHANNEIEVWKTIEDLGLVADVPRSIEAAKRRARVKTVLSRLQRPRPRQADQQPGAQPDASRSSGLPTIPPPAKGYAQPPHTGVVETPPEPHEIPACRWPIYGRRPVIRGLPPTVLVGPQARHGWRSCGLPRGRQWIRRCAPHVLQ